ncbi:DNA-repair protein, UmuC-like domain protein [Rhodopirellula maiorica SM1]|uniref:DNA polymerase IV n=1 Tax=Rhodopirellula maiorica SM1 TaxID=1265738 RepID=M5RGR2_9BACT|nr:DNA polymerase IV [Rhodopirellula maiorica]EMI18530.1 DNA-repair protein, UmuC-like domain protein [Rhodopirellula maiorica SM1]
MILHIDMDAFYASVEQRDNPSLLGIPIVVGGSAKGRGVVAAASYEARRYGVYSAMPMKTALERCGQLVVVPVQMDLYASISRQIREIFHRYTPLVEPLSLDEAFLDVTGCQALFGSAVEIGREIQQAILAELGLNASVGVAPNKFLAKVASGHAKPRGFTVVEPAKVHDFLDPLSIDKIWGVGKRAEARLGQLGIYRVADLRHADLDQLTRTMGRSSANHLYALAWGRDDRAVVPDREAKSISHETTFHTDVSDSEVLQAILLRLTEQVGRRLRRHDRYCSTVTLKLRFSDFQTLARSATLASSSNSTNTLWETVRDTLLPRIRIDQPVRLVGMGVSSLANSRTRQLGLFDDNDGRDSQVDQATDSILDRFGKNAIRRGTTLES